MTAVTACPTCGGGTVPNARFCYRCGSPLVGSTTRAEYKQVTALFADVVGSMDIAAAVGAERLREIMAELVSRGAAVVRRYGGTMEKFTGDGLMALFGAPAALEDHAYRACLAALAIQEETHRLAGAVARRDGVALRLRVGLNSGQVVAGDIGSGVSGYAAIGEQVGLAQRMESVAPPGGVMLSASTAHLVEHAAVLGDVELVSIKGRDAPVSARRLLAIRPRTARIGRTEASLVGRRWEMAALQALVDRTVSGSGVVVNVVGPAGIGKSRVAREAAALAAARGADVYWTHCESHASDIAFDVVTRLLRTASGIADLDDDAARRHAHAQVPDADPQDLLLLDDLLGIADRDVPLPRIDPDARRRRLTALLDSVTLARTEPALYVIEDVHWIDDVSESLVADLLTVIPQTPSMVLITYRPEYDGALTRLTGAQTIALAPLGNSDTAALIGELLGPDPSVTALATIIGERAAGIPFFAEEMVRELAQRGVLKGDRGRYFCEEDATEVTVPATVQAAIEARIDRLSTPAKRTLNAASVIGVRFEADLLASVSVDGELTELLTAELIDRVQLTPRPEYAFWHPLIRTVAYESQLKVDRAEVHGRVAAAIESSAAEAADEHAALIAQHAEAAGDLHAAYGWHMRAAMWATYRDIAAARRSWERARTIADAVPADDPDRTAMRIAPRTMLCGIAWRVQETVAGDRFEELRELCAAAGDQASLAIGMAGLVLERAFRGRIREASHLASEAWTLIESIGDPTLTVGLSFPVIYAKAQRGEWGALLRWSQRTIDLAEGDPSKGDFIFGSPLALAFITRAFGRCCLGHSGWREDLRHGVAMARSADPLSYATVIAYAYWPGISFGVLTPHDQALHEIEDALRIAEQSGDDIAVVWAQAAMGIALVHREADADRSRGEKVLAGVGDMFEHLRHSLSELPLVHVYLARERSRRGHHTEATPLMSAAVDHPAREGHLLAWAYAVPATGVLVETLLDSGVRADVGEAEAAIERLAAAPPADEGLVVRDVWLLRLRALLARAKGDEASYRDYRDRYRAMAQSLGFEGHIAWAEAMT